MSSAFSNSRRRFVTGLASTTALSLLSQRGLTAMPNHRHGAAPPTATHFDLSIGYSAVNFTGQTRQATTINGSLPGPTLHWKEGERVTLNVRNTLAEDSSIHWHGILLPSNMDGVPGLSFNGIRPGESFRYQFEVQQSGTYWYHSHSGFQEQTGLYGAIVVEPRDNPPHSYDRDYVVVLSDWSDESPDTIFANLKRSPHIYNTNQRTLADWHNDVRKYGVSKTRQLRAMWNQMRMSDSDLADVTGRTYTFLMNGKAPADGWVGEFQRGERVLLRFVNAAAMTFFDVRIPGLKMTVVAADGQAVQAVTVDEFRIGAAETYDVIVEPDSEQAYTLFCQAIDRSGFARGTLTPHPDLVASLPEMDESPVLTHIDMGMSHHMQMGNSKPLGNHSSHSHDQSPQAPPAPACSPQHAAMGHCEMMAPSNGRPGKKFDPELMGSGKAGFGTASKPSFAHLHSGPRIDMLATGARYRLDDPGVGLRDNGRRVLTYADLRNLYPSHDQREPGREIELHLTGNMARYMWSIDGISSKQAAPIELAHNERMRITLVNNTMMNHPMHLHGMWSELETGDALYIPRKHTVIVQPGARISYLVNASERGRWAWHCHLLYHMSGMFREFHVS